MIDMFDADGDGQVSSFFGSHKLHISECRFLRCIWTYPHTLYDTTNLKYLDAAESYGVQEHG